MEERETFDQYHQRAMKLLTMKISNLDATREAGDQEQAERQFFEICGVANTLLYLRIISMEQASEINEDLFENHYYLT